MNYSPFYSRWWFKLLAAPLLVALVGGLLLYLILPSNKINKDGGVKVGRDLNVAGDFVAGDKLEYKLSNPIVFKPINSQYKNRVKANLTDLDSKYPDTSLRILLQVINPNDATKQFAYEFKRIMEGSGVPIRVVPHIVVGLPPRRYPIVFKYKNISRAVILDYMSCIDPLFSPEKGKVCVAEPKYDQGIAENFNLLIQFWEQVRFDSFGRIFFR